MNPDTARRHIENAMEALGEEDTIAVEKELQHAHDALEGNINELYPDTNADPEAANE